MPDTLAADDGEAVSIPVALVHSPVDATSFFLVRGIMHDDSGHDGSGHHAADVVLLSDSVRACCRVAGKTWWLGSGPATGAWGCVS